MIRASDSRLAPGHRNYRQAIVGLVEQVGSIVDLALRRFPVHAPWEGGPHLGLEARVRGAETPLAGAARSPDGQGSGASGRCASLAAQSPCRADRAKPLEKNGIG
jgi:hypothetical protein